MAEPYHEAVLWEAEDGASVRCGLCAHRCHIREGKRGTCEVRENRGGALYTLAYGRVIASHIDPIEKKPLFHFLPGSRSYSIATVGCNFRCGFCQNWSISQMERNGRELPGEDVSPLEIAEDARRTKCSSISYTYTEPTIFFEYAIDTAKEAKRTGLKNVFVTNGYQTPEAVGAMKGLIDAANIDLKSFSNDFYRRQCGAKLDPVLESIRLMFDAGIHVEVTTLIVPGLNDSEDELRGIARFLRGLSPDIGWHVSRFHPDYKLTDRDATPESSIFRTVQIGREEGLNYVWAGNLPRRGYEDTVCPNCKKTVIARTVFSINERHLNGSRCGFCDTQLPIITA